MWINCQRNMHDVLKKTETEAVFTKTEVKKKLNVNFFFKIVPLAFL